MRFRLNTFIFGLVIISTIACSKKAQLTEHYFIGQWTHYKGTTTENGITEIDSMSLNGMKYNFKNNGIVSTVFDDHLEWKLSKNMELLLSEDGETATYTIKIESDSSFVLKRSYHNRDFTYHFRKNKSALKP